MGDTTPLPTKLSKEQRNVLFCLYFVNVTLKKFQMKAVYQPDTQSTPYAVLFHSELHVIVK
jgi:hypothetical protein